MLGTYKYLAWLATLLVFFVFFFLTILVKSTLEKFDTFPVQGVLGLQYPRTYDILQFRRHNPYIKMYY